MLRIVRNICSCLWCKLMVKTHVTKITYFCIFLWCSPINVKCSVSYVFHFSGGWRMSLANLQIFVFIFWFVTFFVHFFCINMITFLIFWRSTPLLCWWCYWVKTCAWACRICCEQFTHGFCSQDHPRVDQSSCKKAQAQAQVRPCLYLLLRLFKKRQF